MKFKPVTYKTSQPHAANYVVKVPRLNYDHSLIALPVTSCYIYLNGYQDHVYPCIIDPEFTNTNTILMNRQQYNIIEQAAIIECIPFQFKYTTLANITILVNMNRCCSKMDISDTCPKCAFMTKIIKQHLANHIVTLGNTRLVHYGLFPSCTIEEYFCGSGSYTDTIPNTIMIKVEAFGIDAMNLDVIKYGMVNENTKIKLVFLDELESSVMK
ncbi:Hypothetical protein MVR_LOCUS320 [uncultured virus]|nr:Hypothetical protein MVR_LOCUS320 [uncultured virus]